MQQYDDKFADMRRYKSDDLIERLRTHIREQETVRCWFPAQEVLDEIEKLEKVREAAEEYLDADGSITSERLYEALDACQALGGSDE